MKIKELRERLLKDKGFRKEFEKSDPAFEIGQKILELRVREGLTQAQFAKKLKTKQPAIARLENGTIFPGTEFLGRIASTFTCYLNIEFESNEHRFVNAFLVDALSSEELSQSVNPVKVEIKNN